MAGDNGVRGFAGGEHTEQCPTLPIREPENARRGACAGTIDGFRVTVDVAVLGTDDGLIALGEQRHGGQITSVNEHAAREVVTLFGDLRDGYRAGVGRKSDGGYGKNQGGGQDFHTSFSGRGIGIGNGNRLFSGRSTWVEMPSTAGGQGMEVRRKVLAPFKLWKRPA